MNAAIIWLHYGPYHLARLRAAVVEFESRGDRLAGISVAEQAKSHPWGAVDSQAPGAIQVACPGKPYEDLTAGEIVRGVTRTLDALAPDVVAVPGWHAPEARCAIRWARRRGSGLVLMSDSKRDDAPRRPWKEAMKRRLVGHCDVALVAGRRAREYVNELGLSAARTFDGYDVVDNEYFAKASDEARRNEEAWRKRLGLGVGRYFLTSNRFISRKNLLALLEAYSLYRQEIGRSAWNLVVLGDGPEAPVLRSKVESDKIAGVHLVGFRGIDELPAWYGLASALVHPALQDQWGLVVNEAMSCGLPVLVSRATGCSHDLIEDGANGFVFDPRSVEDIAASLMRIDRVSEEKRASMGRRSREIIANWGCDRFARALWSAAYAALDHADQRAAPAIHERLFLWAIHRA